MWRSPAGNGSGHCVDYDTSAAYLNPSWWKVDLDACDAPAIKDRGASTKVDWTFSGNWLATPINVTGTCKLQQALPKLGTTPWAPS